MSGAVVGVDADWAIVEIVPGVTRSVHPEELTPEQLRSAPPDVVKRIRRLQRAYDRDKGWNLVGTHVGTYP